MSEQIDVNPADLNNAAEQYRELRAAAATLGPQAVEEVNRISTTHGAIGYPLAVGVVAGLARRQMRLEKKAVDFGVYAQRFNEHAATYIDQDHAGARGYGEAQFVSAGSDQWGDPWDDDDDLHWYEPMDPGGAAAGPGAVGGPVPSSLL